MSLEFRQDFWYRKTRVSGLSYAVLNVILGLAIFVQLRLVTDGRTDRQTDRRTDTRWQLIAWRRAVKTVKESNKYVIRRVRVIIRRQSQWKFEAMKTDVVTLFVAVRWGVDDPRQPEVGDLDDQFVGDEHITSRQVAVNYLRTRISRSCTVNHSIRRFVSDSLTQLSVWQAELTI